MFNLFNKRSTETSNEMVFNNNKQSSIDKLSVADQLVTEIRTEFLALASKSSDFDPIDVERVTNDDFTVRRFVNHNHLKKQQAFNHLVETMAWRKSFGVNQLQIADEMPIETVRASLTVVYNRDRDGRPVVYNRMRGNFPVVKSEKWTQRVMTLLAEGIDRLGGSSGHTLVIDFSDLKFYLPNKDELRIFVFNNKLMHFYPGNLARVIIYNLPWILKKVIMPLLKMAMGDVKIKMVNGDELFEYIDKSQVPKFMGGECEDSFTKCFEEAGCNKLCDEIAKKYDLTPDDVKGYKDRLKYYADEFQEILKQVE